MLRHNLAWNLSWKHGTYKGLLRREGNDMHNGKPIHEVLDVARLEIVPNVDRLSYPSCIGCEMKSIINEQLTNEIIFTKAHLVLDNYPL